MFTQLHVHLKAQTHFHYGKQIAAQSVGRSLLVGKAGSAGGLAEILHNFIFKKSVSEVNFNHLKSHMK